jgi:hypothetical protein
MNSKPRWGGSVGRGRNFARSLTACAVPAVLALLPRTREVQAVLLHKGIFASASALLVVFGAKFAMNAGSKRTKWRGPKAACLAPVMFLGEPRQTCQKRLAGCPNATQPETFTVSSVLHKAGQGEFASCLWDLAVRTVNFAGFRRPIARS